MALIFPRIARNFIKNGYFPTDEVTLARICSAIDAEPGSIRTLDPCCGEGAALQMMNDHIESCGADVQSFGIEIDEERAWHAKTVVGTVAHADVHEVRITDRSFGFLFLNPPYGDLVADGAETGDRSHGRLRHEKMFCRRTFNLLQVGGVLVLVVPFHVIDAEFASFIARHFDRITAWMAPEQQFQQCVIFGIKRRPSSPSAEVVARLTTFARSTDNETLPEVWPIEPYEIPTIRPADFAFTVVRLDARQLHDELERGLGRWTLWPRFDELMKPRLDDLRRPLRPMTDWHLALALAAGQLSGVVSSAGGRRLLVKGRTHKTKDTQVVHDVADDGAISETRILTDRFVTTIRGIDLTPGPTLGQLLTIQ